MVHGSVMVTSSRNKINTIVLLEMNCKINSIESVKIPYVVHNDATERYYI